jgi:Ca-activated chloride channel family protein
MIRIACICVLVCASVTLAHTQPTFSARVEGVRVDVLVTDPSRRPLRGLAPQDFEIRDNGVPQQVDIVSFGEIALNVGLAFDLSESVAGTRLEQLRLASNALTSELQPADQSGLITFSELVSLKCPLSLDRSCVNQSLAAAVPSGATALVDGVLAAIIASESDIGRSLLMVFSDGLDTSSFQHTERVLDMGRRSDVVVYSIASKEARPDFLEELSASTGGRLHEANRDEDLSTTFRTILDEFRHRYLVTYTPRGVPRDGWHKLEVRVNRSGVRVKARPGYQGG